MIDQDRWARAYLSEIDRVGRLTRGRILNSVFFGGGTPSLMDPDLVFGIIDRIRQTWTTANDIEITLEANPGSVEADKFRAFGEAGVNRVSMGIQALNDADLKRLGRIHSVAEAFRAFDIAQSVFDRVSFDLIYARQDQTVTAWKQELKSAIGMAADHLSLYQLTIEPGTAFGDRYVRGKLRGLPDEDRAADMYEATQDIAASAGLPAYEVSNHARPGAESRHNLIYWRYGDYAGIGPGAHGRLSLNGQRHATVAMSAPGAWLKALESGQGCEKITRLSGAEQADEYLLMGLRITEGVDIARHQALAGHPLSPDSLHELRDLGLIVDDPVRLRTTSAGRMVLNHVIKTLMSD